MDNKVLQRALAVFLVTVMVAMAVLQPVVAAYIYTAAICSLVVYAVFTKG